LGAGPVQTGAVAGAMQRWVQVCIDKCEIPHWFHWPNLGPLKKHGHAEVALQRAEDEGENVFAGDCGPALSEGRCGDESVSSGVVIAAAVSTLAECTAACRNCTRCTHVSFRVAGNLTHQRMGLNWRTKSEIQGAPLPTIGCKWYHECDLQNRTRANLRAEVKMGVQWWSATIRGLPVPSETQSSLPPATATTTASGSQ